MRNRKVARRYAQALFELTAGKRERVFQQLVEFSRLLAECRDLKELLVNPAFRNEERQRVLGQLTGILELEPPLDRFLSTLVENRRLNLLDDITALFQDMMDHEAGRVRVKVTSARPLEPDQRRVLEEALRQAISGVVILEERVEPGLLAGLKLDVNHLTIDGSLRRQLENLREELLRAGV